jgi:hypothetical protein
VLQGFYYSRKHCYTTACRRPKWKCHQICSHSACRSFIYCVHRRSRYNTPSCSMIYWLSCLVRSSAAPCCTEMQTGNIVSRYQRTTRCLSKRPHLKAEDQTRRGEIFGYRRQRTSQITLQGLEAEIAKITLEMEAAKRDRIAVKTAARQDTYGSEESHQPPPGRSEVAPSQPPETRSKAVSIDSVGSDAPSASPPSAPVLLFIPLGPPS